MIECAFTIDYEIYGNGQGSLASLVHDPARELKAVFDAHGVKFVNFVEALEFERIERQGSDPASAAVRRQIRDLHRDGYETALHLHPQWMNAQFRNGEWALDYAEYNLCTLPPARIAAIVDHALAYLRDVVEDPGFTPVSFRAGNWLFQPTGPAATVLAARGLKIDSSVFKGGVQHAHGLDYRPALKNGFYWNFRDDVTQAVAGGPMLEIPIHVEMVPFWKMLTGKRVSLQKKSGAATPRSTMGQRASRWSRLRDYARPVYPLKFDFCRMTADEMTRMVRHLIAVDRQSPDTFKPMVAIGHTKDLVDLGSIEAFLGFLRNEGIRVATLASMAARCQP